MELGLIVVERLQHFLVNTLELCSRFLPGATDVFLLGTKCLLECNSLHGSSVDRFEFPTRANCPSLMIQLVVDKMRVKLIPVSRPSCDRHLSLFAVSDI